MKKITEIIEKLKFDNSNKNGLISNTQIENAIATNIIFSFNSENEESLKSFVYLKGFERVIFKNVKFENSTFYTISFRNCEFINCSFNLLEMIGCRFYNCSGISCFSNSYFYNLSFVESRNNFRDALTISNCEIVNSEFKTFWEGYKTNITLSDSKCRDTIFEKVSISDSKNIFFQNVSISFCYISSSFYLSNQFEKISLNDCDVDFDINNNQIDNLENIKFVKCTFRGYFYNVNNITNCNFFLCKLTIRNESLSIKNSQFKECDFADCIIEKGYDLIFELSKFSGMLKGKFERANFLKSELTKVKVASEFEKVSFRESYLFPDNFECILGQVDWTDINISSGNLKYNRLNHHDRLKQRGHEILCLTQVNIGRPQMRKITYCLNNNRFYSDFPVLMRKRTNKDVDTQTEIMQILTAGHNFEIFMNEKFCYGIDASEISEWVKNLYLEQLEINENELKRSFSPPEFDFYDDKYLFSNEELMMYFNEINRAIEYLIGTNTTAQNE
jgi:uncharacterized protein YjbI with pentapeptide repeats